MEGLRLRSIRAVPWASSPTSVRVGDKAHSQRSTYSRDSRYVESQSQLLATMLERSNLLRVMEEEIRRKLDRNRRSYDIGPSRRSKGQAPGKSAKSEHSIGAQSVLSVFDASTKFARTQSVGRSIPTMNTNSYSPKKSMPPLAGSEYDDSRGRFSMARESEQFENKGALKEYDGTTRKTSDGEIWEADLVCKDFDSLPKSKEVTQNSPKRSLEQKLDGGPTLAASYCAKVEENGGIEAAEKPIHYQENSATTVQGTVLQKLKENVWILQARKAERDAGKAVSLCTWRKPSNNRTHAFSYVSLDYFGPPIHPCWKKT
ncbi:unnamed protein product [Nesidiocoris tenuis]|uniref:Uncharacterized protein n=1 Tax=Nesidiocoris tenuis TaxID=355587 RepID=A0A6H5HH95_9HEMI|nr:unnamed protein product [Nesidiocoris tenuis]